MPKRVLLLFTLILSTLFLPSCYDSNEITDIAYVHFIGIDEGVKDKWRLTITISAHISRQETSENQASQPAERKCITIDAPSFYSAVNLLNTNIPRKLEFSHANLLAISEEIARSGLIGEYIAPLIRFREIRRTMNVVVVQSSAYEFVEKIEPYLGGSIVNTIEDLMLEAKNTSYFPIVTLNDFYDAMKSTYIQPVVTLGGVYDPDNFLQEGNKGRYEFNVPGRYFAGEVPRKGGSPVELLGSALFDGDRMIGKLDGHETRMLLLARGDFERGIFIIKDPKVPSLVVPIELKLARKPEVDVRFEGTVPVITLNLKTEGDILAIQSRINYEDPKATSILEKAVEKHMKKSLDDVIDKCRSLSCDAFYFGCVAARRFLTIEEWEAYDWNKQFRNAKIITKFDFKIRRTGGLLKSSKIIKSKGRE